MRLVALNDGFGNFLSLFSHFRDIQLARPLDHEIIVILLGGINHDLAH